MDFKAVSQDLSLAVDNLSTAIARIRRSKTRQFSVGKSRQLIELLTTTFWKSLPHFVEGRKHNLIHHHTQVLDNMVQIGLGENLIYPEFRNATLLALVHDIGNAISQHPKVKTDQVVDAFKKSASHGMRKALKAVAFRLEHMDNGPQLARNVFIDFDPVTLGDADMHLICRAIVVHDYPSIAKVLQDLLKKTGRNIGYTPGDFLLPFDNTSFGRLITWLREADRLYMLSEQGVLKDLADAREVPSPKNIRAKLKSNADKHRNEFLLYRAAGKTKGFKVKTLYRTTTGYGLYKSFQQAINDKYKSVN